MDIPQISFPNTDKEFINNPYPYLKELREKSPLHLDVESGLVLITHFDDVKNVQKSKMPSRRSAPPMAHTPYTDTAVTTTNVQ